MFATIHRASSRVSSCGAGAPYIRAASAPSAPKGKGRTNSPHGSGLRVSKLILRAYTRPERWRLIKVITEFENRQMAAVKNEVD